MQDRERQFAGLLAAPVLDGYALKHACLHGHAIPDKFRPDVYRLLLGVADWNKGKRKESLQKKREQYYGLQEELLGSVSKQPLPEARKAPQDTWLDDIDKDVRRTQTSYAFFARTSISSESQSKIKHRRSLFERLDRLHPYRKQEIEERYNLAPEGQEQSASGQERDIVDRNFECLIRILYIFAVLNPVHYVQGMSELIAPLYYTFSHSQSGFQDDASHAEADTFWAFSNLMGEIGDFYMQDSDGAMLQPVIDQQTHGVSKTGLGATLKRFAKELQWLDAELAYNLHRKKEVQPTFYALRWITCLLAMEFRIPDLIRLWDSLFALMADTRASSQLNKARSHETDGQAREFLVDICCAMVLLKRDELLSSGFATCIGTLQNYVCDDVHAVLALASSIRAKRIAAYMTGLDFSDYDSVPNSPAIGSNEDEDENDILPALPVPANLQSAKSLFSAAAGSSTAKALRSRLWGRTGREVDFPDDMSDISTATAPPVLEQTARSPNTLPSTPSHSSASTNFSPTSANSQPSSASSLFSKYAASFQQSDAAAALSKATTNSYIQALQWKEAAPGTFNKLKEDVTLKVSGAAGAAKTVIRPPSPTTDPPFTPPTFHSHSASYSISGKLLSPDSASHYGNLGLGTSVPMSDRRSSSGPKPLLLSSSARRGSGTPESPNISPSMSRRGSHVNVHPHEPGSSAPPSENGSPLQYRTFNRSPSPNHAMSGTTGQYGHGRAASAFNFGTSSGHPGSSGTYRLHQSRSSISGMNGHSEHTRTGSLASLGRSQRGFDSLTSPGNASLHGALPVFSPSPLDELSLGNLGLADSSDQSIGRTSAQVEAAIRQKGASTEVEELDDQVLEYDPTLSPQSHKLVSPPPRQSSASVAPSQFITPPATPSKNGKQADPAEEVTLSPKATLSRHRKPRSSSLAQDSQRPSVATESIQQAEDNPSRPSRRKLASSRKITTRNDSFGSSASLEGSIRSSIDTEQI